MPKYLKSEIKGKLYNIILKPVLTYGSESFTLAIGNEEKLRTFERKVRGQLEKRKDG
jgi:hypothetical protein